MEQKVLSPERLREVALKLDVASYCKDLAKAGTEHANQRAFFGWLQWATNVGLEHLACFAYAVPNGGERNAIVAARLKSEGVKSGVPDVCWPVPRGRYAALYIELKVAKGTVSEKQREWHCALRLCGNAVAVCWGWEAAVKCFNDYRQNLSVANEYR